MTCISVLLPDPFSPTSPTSSPGCTSSDAPRSTSVRRRCQGGPDENAFVTSPTASAGVVAAGLVAGRAGRMTCA